MSLFTGLMGYLQGRVAEYETPKKLIAKGEGREGLANLHIEKS